MKFPGFLRLHKPKTRRRRLAVNSADLFLYQAITGRSPEIIAPKTPVVTAAEAVDDSDARRWTPSVADFAVKLRTVWEQGLDHSVRKPEIADWLRHISDEAFKRMDQAHMRLHTDRPDPTRRRVQAREVMSVQPVDESEPTRSYKRVA